MSPSMALSEFQRYVCPERVEPSPSGSKGKTPAAQWAEGGSGSGFTPWGRGGGRKGFNNILTPAEMGTKGIRWSPVGKRQMASVKTKGYTPFKTTIKLNNAVKRNRTQNYADRSI